MKEIKPTYITFEQAKWLKEKGFDESCRMLINGAYEPFHLNLIETQYFQNNSVLLKDCYSAPEQWQVVEWLRFNHDIWVSVIKIDGFQDLYYYTITGSSEFFNNGRTITVEEWDDETCDKMGYNNKYFNSPQEAYSAAFDYIKDNNLI
jgi:hypothetical protein